MRGRCPHWATTLKSALRRVALLRQVDVDRDPRALAILPPGHLAPLTPIVVEATSPGLAPGRAVVQVSADVLRDSVLAVARRSSHVASAA